MVTDKLPVKAAIPSLSAALVANSSAVLCAPPGSGKTTLVPLELLQSSWLTGRILMLEPRRLAARAAAGRMAFLLGEAVGETVGYSIRLERRVSAKTRIEVVTEGILTQRLQKDPSLDGVSLVIFDEFHVLLIDMKMPKYCQKHLPVKASVMNYPTLEKMAGL